MNKFFSVLRLMRVDKPVGFWLLWWPTFWALILAASPHYPAHKITVLFLLGTFLMRSAGCVINDIADRNIDRHVKRTQNRPLTSNQISLALAIPLFIVLVGMAIIIFIELPKRCAIDGYIALLVAMIYPLCKRFFSAPQLVLGVAFSMGIPMAFHTHGLPLGLQGAGLMLINMLWTIAYDTEYAMVDRDDDLILGVKSTAILLGRFDVAVITLLLLLAHSLLPLVLAIKLNALFVLVWGLALVNLLYQIKLIRSRERGQCFKAFKLNAWYGAMIALALLVTD